MKIKKAQTDRICQFEPFLIFYIIINFYFFAISIGLYAIRTLMS